MKKLMKKKSFRYILAAVLLMSCFYGLYRGYHYWRYGQYVYYEPELEMKAYAFFNDGRAVVIDWEQKDKATDKKFLSVAKRTSLTKASGVYAWIVVGKQYATTTTIKLKDDPIDKSYNRNEVKSGEIWKLHVYDLSGERIVKKTYDIFKAVKAYDSTKAPTVYYNYRIIYVIGGKEYQPIVLRSTDNPEDDEVALINLSNGKIEANPQKNFYFPYKANRLSNTTSLSAYYDGKIEDYDIASQSSYLTKEGIITSKTWQLKDESPKALKLLQNGRSRLYILSNKTDPKLATSVWQQLLPEGQDIFDNLTIYERFTVDGQEHTVNSYDEFARYYKTTDEMEETDGRKDD